MRAMKTAGWTIGLMLLLGTPIAAIVFPTEPAIAQAAAQTADQTADQTAIKTEALRLSDEAFKLYQMSRFEPAIELWQQALKLYRQTDDKISEGRVLGGIGSAYNGLSQYDQAIEYQTQRLELARMSGDRRGEGRALGHLGEIYENLSQYEKAIDYQTKSLGRICKLTIGSKSGVSLSLE